MAPESAAGRPRQWNDRYLTCIKPARLKMLAIVTRKG
jgi:hypothetical protein